MKDGSPIQGPDIVIAHCSELHFSFLPKVNTVLGFAHRDRTVIVTNVISISNVCGISKLFKQTFHLELIFTYQD